MIFSGRAHKIGAHIDTDAIIPARFLVSTDPLELGKNCMEGLEPGWIQRIEEGDILVAGENFGCGSSREHAPLAILGAGIKVVVAHSFARIFYRNGFNMGLTLVEIGPEVEKIADGDRLQVDAANGAVIDETAGVEIAAKPVPPFMRDILDKGGLVEYVKARLAA